MVFIEEHILLKPRLYDRVRSYKIMAVPRHSHTRSKTGKHRMHLYIKPSVLVACRKCGKKILSHQVCKFCGYYKGKEVVNVLAKLSKKEKKAKEHEIKENEKSQKADIRPPPLHRISDAVPAAASIYGGLPFHFTDSKQLLPFFGIATRAGCRMGGAR